MRIPASRCPQYLSSSLVGLSILGKGGFIDLFGLLDEYLFAAGAGAPSAAAADESELKLLFFVLPP